MATILWKSAQILVLFHKPTFVFGAGMEAAPSDAGIIAPNESSNS